MPVNIYNDIEAKEIDEDLINKIYLKTLEHFKLKDVFDIDITIVTSDTIRQTNNETRHIDKVTDVLSFPYVNMKFPFKKKDYKDDISPDTNNIMLGDIMLCESRAIEQAKEYGHSITREVGFLVLHGFLHLLGFDHIEKEDEIIMFKHADEILESLNILRG